MQYKLCLLSYLIGATIINDSYSYSIQVPCSRRTGTERASGLACSSRPRQYGRGLHKVGAAPVQAPPVQAWLTQGWSSSCPGPASTGVAYTRLEQLLSRDNSSLAIPERVGGSYHTEGWAANNLCLLPNPQYTLPHTEVEEFVPATQSDRNVARFFMWKQLAMDCNVRHSYDLTKELNCVVYSK